MIHTSLSSLIYDIHLLGCQVQYTTYVCMMKILKTACSSTQHLRSHVCTYVPAWSTHTRHTHRAFTPTHLSTIKPSSGSRSGSNLESRPRLHQKCSTNQFLLPALLLVSKTPHAQDSSKLCLTPPSFQDPTQPSTTRPQTANESASRRNVG